MKCVVMEGDSNQLIPSFEWQIKFQTDFRNSQWNGFVFHVKFQQVKLCAKLCVHLCSAPSAHTSLTESTKTLNFTRFVSRVILNWAPNMIRMSRVTKLQTHIYVPHRDFLWSHTFISTVTWAACFWVTSQSCVYIPPIFN